MKTLLLGLMLLSSTAFAKEGGNGGDGMIIKGKIYLLDLIEAGVELDPWIDHSRMVHPEYLMKVKQAIQTSTNVQELIAAKLSEIHEISPLTAYSILKTIESYSFRFVSKDLVDINDEDTLL